MSFQLTVEYTLQYLLRAIIRDIVRVTLKNEKDFYINVTLIQAKKAAAINGQLSSSPVTVKSEPKSESIPSKSDTSRTSTVKKESATTPSTKKETTTSAIKKEPMTSTIKKERKRDSAPPKRKNTNIDSDDDDVPLVSYLFNSTFMYIIIRQRKRKVNH